METGQFLQEDILACIAFIFVIIDAKGADLGVQPNM
jgi:hypothetical protein